MRLFLLLFPTVRKSFKKKSSTEPKTYGKRHAMGLVIFDKVLSIGAIILLQYAMATGTVTLVSALSGLQYVLMFVLVFLMTKFLPQVFKEYFTYKELTVQVIAIILVVLGLALLVF